MVMKPSAFGERGHRPRPFAKRVGRRTLGAIDQVDQQVFGSADLAVEPATASRAIVSVDGTRSPASRRITGATNSWNVKIAEVGNPGRIATGTEPTAPRQIGLPGLRATPWTRDSRRSPGQTR